jgi:cytochrome c553
MARIFIFVIVAISFVAVLILNKFNKLPISNNRFSYENAKNEYLKNENSEPGAETAAPATAVVLNEFNIELNSPELINGNKVFGKCIACHGKSGAGNASLKAPRIGGQYDFYILKQLNDMKNGARINDTMMPIIKGLSDQDFKDVALYASKLPWK